MRVFARAVATLAFVIAGVATAYAAPAAKHHLPPKPKPLTVVLNTPDKCLAAIGYTESRGDSLAAERQTVYVGHYRSLLNTDPGWGKATDCGSALSGQFSGIKGKKLVIKERDAWKQSLSIAGEVRHGWRPEGELRYATYFLNPLTSATDNRCWFERSLMPITFVGLHLFYREPVKQEVPQPSAACALQTAQR